MSLRGNSGSSSGICNFGLEIHGFQRFSVISCYFSAHDLAFD